MNGLLVPWMAEIGIITWRDFKGTSGSSGHVPFPSELLATFIIFGGFSLIPEKYSTIAAALGWGVVLATFLKAFDPANPQLKIGGASPFPGWQPAQGQAGSNPSNPTGTGFVGIPGRPQAQ